MRFASRRRLNDFKSTSDRHRVDVGPTKDDGALTSSRGRLVMWVCGPEEEIVVAHGRLPSPARRTLEDESLAARFSG